MSKAKGRSRAEIYRAIRRVNADGAVPMYELMSVSGASERTLVGYATDGRHGIFLDAINRGGEWYPSRAAVGRFLAEVARFEEEEERRAAGNITTGGRG